MIDITPNPVAFNLGPLTVYWYGICYAVGLFVVYQVVVRLAARRHLDATLIGDGMIVIAVAALIGGRAYHVIDQWALYKDDLMKIVLPPYSGLGVYGGIFTGTIAAWAFIRWKHQSFSRWADVIAPGLFVMQAIGRFGNFFNQELYGPPTNLPWGIAIQCKYRIADIPATPRIFQCPLGSDPNATLGQHFIPLFAYEAISAIVGLAVLLWLGRRLSHRLRSGDLLLVFLAWYSVTRFSLEFLRADNWTFFAIPTAQIVAGLTTLVAVAVLVVRHARPGPSMADLDALALAMAQADASADADPAMTDPAMTDPDEATAPTDLADPTLALINPAAPDAPAEPPPAHESAHPAAGEPRDRDDTDSG